MSIKDYAACGAVEGRDRQGQSLVSSAQVARAAQDGRCGSRRGDDDGQPVVYFSRSAAKLGAMVCWRRPSRSFFHLSWYAITDHRIGDQSAASSGCSWFSSFLFADHLSVVELDLSPNRHPTAWQRQSRMTYASSYWLAIAGRG